MKYVEEKDMDIEIDGMGLVIYSEGAMADVALGCDYFKEEFSKPTQVATHIRKGDITGFCTGSGGSYKLKIREGFPTKNEYEEYQIAIRLGLHVLQGDVCVKDIFWLMDWNPDCPNNQKVHIEHGFYRLTILTSRPESGVWGDQQTICVYFEHVDCMPELTWNALPQLFTE